MTHAEIEAFLAVCEYHTFTKAAEALFIGQSALSTRLKNLEDEVGCRLLIRSKGQREIELTWEGKQFYELAIQYRDILQKMQDISGSELRGRIRIASIHSLGTYLLPQVYGRFLETHPSMKMEIQDLNTPEACDSLERGLTDLSFGTDHRQIPGLEIIPVVSEEMVFVCSKESSYPDRVPLSKLSTGWELYSSWCDTFDSWHNEAFGVHAQPRVKLELMRQLEYFLTKSENWAIVPYSVAVNMLESGNVRLCEMEFSVPPRITYCLSRTGSAHHPAVGPFLDCLKETVASMDGRYIRTLL